MESGPSDMDQMFAGQGGFAAAYKKLVVLAHLMLAMYGGDSRARVVLRQLDAEEIVNDAFKRLLNEPVAATEVPYYVLRRHIKNHVRSLAKNTKEGRTVRIESDEKGKTAYAEATDPNETNGVERMMIFDDFEFCKKVIFRVVAEINDDKEVLDICEAIVVGFRTSADIQEYAKIDQATFEVAFKRLKRKFGHALMAIKREEKS
jgi:hypothetical protein